MVIYNISWEILEVRQIDKIADEIIKKLDNNSLAINVSMETGKRMMRAIQEKIRGVSCYQIDDVYMSI